MEMSLCNSFRSLAVTLVILSLAVAPRASAFTLGREHNSTQLARGTDQDKDASSPQEQKNELIQRNEIKHEAEPHQLKPSVTTVTTFKNASPTTGPKDIVPKNATNSKVDNHSAKGEVKVTNMTDNKPKNETTKSTSTETTTIDSFLENKTEGSSAHSYSSSVDQLKTRKPEAQKETKETTQHPDLSKRETQSAETRGSSTATPTRPVYSVAVPPQEPRAWQNYTSIERNKNTIDDEGSKTTASMTPFITEATRIKHTEFTEKDEDTTISLSSIFTEVPTITTEAEETTTDIFYPIEAEILSSKRGGYLDMTKRDPTPASVITKIAKKSQVVKKTTPVGTTSTSTTPATTSTTTTRRTTTAAPTVRVPEIPKRISTIKVAGDDALTHLNEDAIKDELLMEQILSDNEEFEFAKRHRGDRNTRTTEIPRTFETSTSGESSVEDLSVKPISKGFYTVSPNYRKMKKMEVTAARLPVRNPDDNSWRNESLSSLGIVFNAKNTSKTFTQVIKNKTESVLGSNELIPTPSPEAPELRQRLEKLGEVRKKKKPNRSGEFEGEYDEYSYEPYYRQNGGYRSTIAPRIPTELGGRTNERRKNIITTEKPRKLLNILEYFDTGDDEAFDYVTAPQIDIKKESPAAAPPTTAARHIQEALRHYPDRKPTLQYFPPLVYSKAPPQIDDDYDNNFKNKVNQYTTTKASEDFGTKVTTESYKNEYTSPLPKKPKGPDRNVYYTSHGQGTPQSHSYHDNGYSKASYTIRHQGDAVTESPGGDGNIPPRFTALPPPTTITDFLKRLKTTAADDYVSFRKQVMDKFDGHFDGEKKLYPILYNNSVVHQEFDGGRVLSSSFLRGLYKEVPPATQPPLLEQTRPCDHCEGPEPALAYELHYYVPGQEDVDKTLLA